jgi:hypothetical protein
MTLPPAARAGEGRERECAPHRLGDPLEHPGPRARLAAGESTIKCPSPRKVLKGTYDHSCY